MSLLDDAVKFVSDELEANFAEEQLATYRSGIGSVQVSVTLGQTRSESADESGAVVGAALFDILVLTTALVISGVRFLPTPGDQIALADGRILEVLEMGGDQHYRYFDPFNRRLRIHCKFVDEEEPSS